MTRKLLETEKFGSGENRLVLQDGDDKKDITTMFEIVTSPRGKGLHIGIMRDPTDKGKEENISAVGLSQFTEHPEHWIEMRDILNELIENN